MRCRLVRNGADVLYLLEYINTWYAAQALYEGNMLAGVDICGQLSLSFNQHLFRLMKMQAYGSAGTVLGSIISNG